MRLDIYSTIKRRILYLEYSPGQILNENVLAEEFGVSRTPVREALYKLEWEKLITIMPRTGAMITQVEFQKLRDVYQIRIIVEGLLGRLAAEKISKDQIQELENLKEQLRKAKAPEELIDTDMKFREVLNASANNSILKEISDYLYNLTLRVWYLVFDNNNLSGELQEGINEYEKMIEVLSKRDPQEAENLRQKIIIGYVERIKDRF